MVQLVLIEKRAAFVSVIGLLVILLFGSAQGASKHSDAKVNAPPDLLLEGGRKLSFERVFSSEREVRKKPGLFGKVLNFIAGEPAYKSLVQPYSIAVDSRGRTIVTDPGAKGVHIFDFAQQKYKFIERRDKARDAMLSPQCVAVDSSDNIYVTDSIAGKIFVFNADGKFKRVIGSSRSGEGFFKRPTGIAVDSQAQLIYITDTLRDKIFVLEMNGSVLRTIGQRGETHGEFNFPTELKLDGHELVVVDAMNFRVERFDSSGAYLGGFGQLGDSSGGMFRPKGVAVDSEGHYYVADGLWGVVQVFDKEGRLLYYFGKRGTEPGDFQLPAGLFITRDDHVYVVDSQNRRIQEFRYTGIGMRAAR